MIIMYFIISLCTSFVESKVTVKVDGIIFQILFFCTLFLNWLYMGCFVYFQRSSEKSRTFLLPRRTGAQKSQDLCLLTFRGGPCMQYLRRQNGLRRRCKPRSRSNWDWRWPPWQTSSWTHAAAPSTSGGTTTAMTTARVHRLACLRVEGVPESFHVWCDCCDVCAPGPVAGDPRVLDAVSRALGAVCMGRVFLCLWAYTQHLRLHTARLYYCVVALNKDFHVFMIDQNCI